MCSTDIFLGLLALFFPPLPVWVKTGICSADSLINFLLCMLGFLPGLLHAWYIIAKFPEPDWDYQGPADAEAGRVYVFAPNSNALPPQQQQQQPRPQQPPRLQHHHHQQQQQQQQGKAAARPAANYGTNNAAPPHHQQQQQQQGPHDDAGEGSSDMPPPSYAQVVAGDHKIQSQD